MAAYSLVSPKELSIFCKEMSVLFYSQITLLEGSLLLAEQSDNKHMKRALTEIHEQMTLGHTFAESMAQQKHVFTAYLCSMVSIGEMSGSLDDIFSRMSDYFNKEYRIRKKLRSAATYPLALTVLMAGVIVMLITRILPMFSDLLYSMGGEMPAFTYVVLSSGEFLAKNIIFILMIVLVIVLAAILFMRTPKGKQINDKAKIKVPLLREVHIRIFTARFARSLSILLKSGIQLLTALNDILPTVENVYLEGILQKKIMDVQDGKKLSDALAEMDLFPPVFLRLLTVGQNTGHLDEMMSKAADVFDDEADDAIEKITVVIEPVLMIILAVIVGAIMLSVMFPMINIMNAIG